MESERLAFAKAVKKARRELRVEARPSDPSVDNIANSLVLDFFSSLPFQEGKCDLLHGSYAHAVDHMHAGACQGAFC